jgi:negative regulator of replication initiation
MNYVSHARTPEELKAEVCSDLNRRLINLESYSNTVARNATEKARISRAMVEIQEILEYWKAVEIVRPIRKRDRVISKPKIVIQHQPV